MNNGIARRELLLSSAAVAVATRSGVAGATQARPDILFILADDLGYADLSIYGRRDYQTPVLDRLARLLIPHRIRPARTRHGRRRLRRARRASNTSPVPRQKNRS